MIELILAILGLILLGGYVFFVLRWIYRLPRSFSIPHPFSNHNVKQADRLLHRGEYDSAIAQYSRAIARHPENVDAYLGRSHAYIRLNELDKALSDCNTVTLLQPDNHFAFLNRGAIYALNENHQQAVVETTHCLELQSACLDGLFNRARYYSELGKTEEAIEDYSRAMELGYQSWELFYYRGYAFYMIGNTQQSQSDYQNAIQLKPYDDLIKQNPNEASHYFYRGFLYTGAGLYPKAIEDYSRAVELGDQSAELLTARGYTYLKMKAFEKAQADFERAIQSDTEAGDAYNCLAWLLATCPVSGYRDGNRALELARRNCELADTTRWNDLGTLAAAHAEVGQFDEAIRWIREAMTKAPELELHRCEAQLACFEKHKPYTDDDTES